MRIPYAVTQLSDRASAAARRALAAVAPGGRAWLGAALGLALAVTVLLVPGGLALASRRGAFIDVLTAIVFGWLAVLVISGGLLLLSLLVRWIPPPIRAVGIGGTVVVGILFVLSGGPWALLVAAFLIAASALAGAGAMSLARRGPRQRLHLVTAAGGLAIGLAGLIVGVGWLVADGPVAVEDPLQPRGPFAVRALTYGSGEPAWRSEFGDSVRTPTVDGRPFLENWHGWAGDMRTDFWGFGPDALPLNATVWYPDAAGPFPLVLIAHGNARMELPSDAGYLWLAEDLASHGFVVASIDMNFLNISLTRGLDLGGDNDARAWLFLEHLRLWRDWHGDTSSPLHGIADLDRIALVGHSRGGEAAATAAYFNQLDRYPEHAAVTLDAGFGIRSVVALAPIDGQYEPAGRPTPMSDTSYLVIHGGMDGDVVSFVGLRQYQRASFSGDSFGVRSAVYLPDANHGQFNTEWGRFDAPGPAGALLDAGAIMPPELQRDVARVAILGFLRATLEGDAIALESLRDERHPAWPEAGRPILRYSDTTEHLIAGFDEDSDPASGTLADTRLEGHGMAVWREEPAPLRLGNQGTNVAVLGWTTATGGSAPWFSIELPPDWSAPADPVLVMSMADSGQPPPGETQPASEPVDLHVEVIDADGHTLRVRLGDLGGVPVAQVSRRLKAPLPEWVGSVEPVARTFRISLSSGSSRLDPTRIREVRFVFDRTPAGQLHLESVGIGSESLPAVLDLSPVSR